jgi:hypothetical protein
MPLIADAYFDLALAGIIADSNRLDITSSEATSFTEARTTFSLGNKASPSLGAAANGAVNGRRTTVAAITDGTVTGTGTAGFWALTKTTGSVLVATGALAATQSVTSGNIFTTAAFDITIADAT